MKKVIAIVGAILAAVGLAGLIRRRRARVQPETTELKKVA